MKVFSTFLRLIVFILYVGYAYHAISYLKVDNSIERWLPKDSEEIIKYERFLEEFSSDALLILTFENPDSASLQSGIKQKIETVKKLKHVNSVSSWPVKHIQYKRKVNNSLSSYLVRFEPESHLNPNRPELLDDISSIFENPNLRVHLAGTGVIHRAINIQTRDAMGNYLLAGMLILFFALILLIKKPIPIIQALCVSIGGVSSIIYASWLFNIPISLAHTIIPIIILFYSTSISLHILFHSGNFRKILKPSTMVVVTTCIGFSVFLFDDTPLLNDFAILGLAGLIGSFIWSLIIFYPNTYEYEPSKKIGLYFERLPILRKGVTLPIFIIAIGLSIPGLLKLKAEIYSLSVLSKENKAYQDHLLIQTNVGNYFPVEFIIDKNEIDVKQMSKWINAIFSMNQIDAVIAYYRFPFQVDKREIGYQSKIRNDVYRVTFMAPLLSTTQGMNLVDNINKISAQYFNKNSPELTGFVTLYGYVARNLLSSFKQSLIFSFLIIFCLLTLYLGRIKLILLALVTNLFPIITMLGLMGWLQINLDMVTIPIGCLLFSIVVDDTIHFMYWYKTKKDTRGALIQAGPGILFTTILLSLGFSTLLFADAPPVNYFAILSLMALGTALLADIFLLPSLLAKDKSILK